MQHFKKLRNALGKEAGEEAFENLIDLVSERSAAAGLALKARQESLLTVHRVKVPYTLNGTLANTNIIENSIRNWREATHNVKLWNEKESMIPRWTAAGLLWAEAVFRKVRGHREFPQLASTLVSCATASSMRSPAPTTNTNQPLDKLLNQILKPYVAATTVLTTSGTSPEQNPNKI